MNRRTLIGVGTALLLAATTPFVNAQERTEVTLLYTATSGFLTAWVATDQG